MSFTYVFHLHSCLLSVIYSLQPVVIIFWLVPIFDLFPVRSWYLILFQVILKFYDLRCRDSECSSNVTFEEKCSILLDDSADNWSFCSDGGTSTLKYIVNLKPLSIIKNNSYLVVLFSFFHLSCKIQIICGTKHHLGQSQKIIDMGNKC